MYSVAISAEYVNDYRIAVRFADGCSGVVDFSGLIETRPAFARIRDRKAFRDFHINEDFGVLCWGEDLDIAPEALYELAVGEKRSLAIAESRETYGVKPPERQ